MPKRPLKLGILWILLLIPFDRSIGASGASPEPAESQPEAISAPPPTSIDGGKVDTQWMGLRALDEAPQKEKDSTGAVEKTQTQSGSLGAEVGDRIWIQFSSEALRSHSGKKVTVYLRPVETSDVDPLSGQRSPSIQRGGTPEDASSEWLKKGWAILPPRGSVEREAVPTWTEQGELRLQVSPLKGGLLEFPSVLLLVEGESIQFESQALQLQVHSAVVAGEKEGKAGPTDPLGLDRPWVFWAVLLGALLGVAVLAGIIFWRSKKRKEVVLPIQKERELSPLEQAEISWKKLTFELEAAEWIKHKQFKKAYFGLSEILKAYLSGQFEVDAKESTSRELIMALRQIRIQHFGKSTETQDLEKGALPVSNSGENLPLPSDGVMHSLGKKKGEVSKNSNVEERIRVLPIHYRIKALTPDRIEELNSRLQNLDQIKFTDAEPDAKDAEEMLHGILSWIRSVTARMEVSEAQNSSNSIELKNPLAPKSEAKVLTTESPQGVLESEGVKGGAVNQKGKLQ